MLRQHGRKGSQRLMLQRKNRRSLASVPRRCSAGTKLNTSVPMREFSGATFSFRFSGKFGRIQTLDRGCLKLAAIALERLKLDGAHRCGRGGDVSRRSHLSRSECWEGL